jgi:starch-binding outer membrane protein, SusD/RagB family
MKTIKIIYLLVATATIITIASCSKDFVEIEPKGNFLTENYYANADQAFGGLVAIYDVVHKNTGGFQNIVAMMNSGSDDHFCGGGSSSDGLELQVFSNYSINGLNIPESYWSDHYQGVFRANVLLEKLPNVQMDNALKARFTAEAKALRALYYFNLVRMFKNIPLITVPLTTANIYNVPQANPTSVYEQIEKDLSESINVLPVTLANEELGRVTKGAAQALLGKVYLYNNKNALAAAQLAEVNGTPGGTSQYGYKLLTNFDDLWIFSNKFNSESILEASHTEAGNSSYGAPSGSDDGNWLNQMVGPRNYTRTPNSDAPDLPSGWSFNVVTVDLYNTLKNDPRFNATILDMKALKAAGKADYIAAYQDTGYFINKFMPKKSDVHVGAGNFEINYKQNSYIIRLADTYLMEAEALGGTGARAQALLDAVRARVGLAPITVSIDAIQKERRLELAGEGHRWFDLVRTGKAATTLASRGFIAGKNEIFPIPARELQNTLLVQNPNY